MPRFALSARRIARDLAALGETHQAVRQAVARFGCPQPRRHPEGFASLVRALTGQQLSGKAAATIYGRVEAHFGAALEPARVMRTRVTTLRSLGLSGRKAEYLKALGKAVHDGRLPLDSLARRPDDEVIALISAVRGFGVWSAEMYLIFSLGRPDVWPVDDLGVRKGMQAILGRPECPTPRELRAEGPAYAPYRSALSLLCWRVASGPPDGQRP